MHTAIPTNPIDARARRALRSLAACTPDLADRLRVNPRTLQRIIAGRRYFPQQLAGDAARVAHQLAMPVTALPLRDWARWNEATPSSSEAVGQTR